MPKGLGILIAPAGTKKGKASMYDEEEGADEAPESERAEGGSLKADLETLFGSADEDMVEAFKSAVKACFDEYEKEPHEEGPHMNED